MTHLSKYTHKNPLHVGKDILRPLSLNHQLIRLLLLFKLVCDDESSINIFSNNIDNNVSI